MKRLLLVGLVGLSCLGLTGCGPHSEAWKQADLDRNRLDLGLYRLRTAAQGPGMTERQFAGSELATWVENGEVVDAGGGARLRDGGDLYVVVRYEFDRSGFLGSSESPRVECWRFTTLDGYGVVFDESDCP